MFGALVFDSDPITTADIPAGFLIWCQVVGGFSFVAILFWLLLGYTRMRPQERQSIPRRYALLYVALLLLGTIDSIAAGIAVIVAGSVGDGSRVGQVASTIYFYTTAFAGFCFILVIAIPFLRGVLRMRWRRIFALSKLSFKEALRRRVLYAFASFALVILFASWFLFDTKPEDQIRTYVDVVFFALAAIMLPAAALVSAFSIPADIKNQTIHTVVTKPVERFEIILGRFFGFLALLTLVLVVLTSVSLLYVVRGISKEAAAESVKAREPLYGVLRFENTDSEKKGISVGREWDYRGYITSPGPGQERTPQTARWDFATVPANLANRKDVRFEYTFDVYRTTKGDREGTGVTCEVRLYSWRYRPGNDVLYTEELRKKGESSKDALAEKYGYYERLGLVVTDYHTQDFLVPGGLFKNINAGDTEMEEELKRSGQARPPELTVKVTCKSATQYVGMARYDLYLRLDNVSGVDTFGFAVNFFKAAFGLWLLMALVIGLCVVLSSHLSGVISLIVVATLFFCGLGIEFIESVATGKNAGGGPAESMLRIFRREISGPRLADSQSTTDRIVYLSDDTFRWGIRRILKIFPDVNEFFLSEYVAEGFSISWTRMMLDMMLLVGYLLPWFVLSYFLIRWREIAGTT